MTIRCSLGPLYEAGCAEKAELVRNVCCRVVSSEALHLFLRTADTKVCRPAPEFSSTCTVWVKH